MMTVERLIKKLEKFPKDYVAIVEGGEGAEGDWATLTICENDEDAILWRDGIVLLTEDEEE